MISLIKKKGMNPQTKEVIYFPQWTRVATATKKSLAKIMARGSTFSVGEVEGTMTDFSQHICDELLAGNAVQIDGLGTFKLKVSGKARTKMEEVTSAGATIAVTFEPDGDLTQRLNTEREFQFVAKPTVDGEQDVDDGDGQPADGGGQTDGGGEDKNAPDGDLMG